MISSAKVTVIFVLLTAASFVAGDGKCGEDDLKALGMLKVDDAQYQRLLKAAKIMSNVGKDLGRKAGDHDSSKYAEKILELFDQYGIRDVDKKCIDCFAASVKCSVKNCKGPCMIDSCSAGCLNCFEKKCKDELSDCVGRNDLDDHCRIKGAFKDYILQ